MKTCRRVAGTQSTPYTTCVLFDDLVVTFWVNWPFGNLFWLAFLINVSDVIKLPLTVTQPGSYQLTENCVRK